MTREQFATAPGPAAISFGRMCTTEKAYASSSKAELKESNMFLKRTVASVLGAVAAFAATLRRHDNLILEDLVSEENQVTLITTFHLRDGVPLDHFVRLWTEVAHSMERRPGFVSARLYRVSRPGEAGRYIQVAHWARGSLLAAARADPEVRLVQRDVHKLLTRADRIVCKPATEEIVPSH